MEPLAIATKIASVLEDKQGREIQIIKIGDLSILADYFVIATGTSSTHIKTLVDEVDFQLSKERLKPKYQDTGAQNWKVLDYADVVLHVFDDEARKFYNLEHLWADGEKIAYERES